MDKLFEIKEITDKLFEIEGGLIMDKLFSGLKE